jgi:branched-subunit amino acid transport protein
MSMGLTLLAAGIATYLTRLSFIALAHRGTAPAWITRPLRLVPAAVLSALILPSVLAPQGMLQLWPLSPRTLAGMAAVLVAWKTRSVLLTLVVGMSVLWLAGLLLPG